MTGFPNGICPFGDDGRGAGCILPAGHDGPHFVTPGDGDEDNEAIDSDSAVLALISDIASRLQDATDSGEYHAVCLIHQLANGRTTVAEARAELADIEFGHT